jgi:DNA-directed RNA polymerase sigma subunit (sigma70/sigma32)
MDALRLAIARGIPRDHAMVEAHRSGLTLQAIGDVYNLTRERVRQIIAAH